MPIPDNQPATLLDDALAQCAQPAFAPAFESWLADQRDVGSLRRPHAAEVYRSMWESFAAWCLGRNPSLTLTHLTAADLQAYQAERLGRKASDLSLSPRYTLRLMRLIDRVLRHHAAAKGEAQPNTAAADWIMAHPEIRYAEAEKADPLPDFLTTLEARQLIAHLSAARPRPGRNHDALAFMRWQEVRNRASVALQLGAGLTPGDVRALTLDSPVAPRGAHAASAWRLKVPGNGTSQSRETPIAPWAAQLLQHWLVVRQAAGVAGIFLFPSTRTGKPWLADSQFKNARQVLEDAGMGSREGGSFRLRHSFALRQLRRGTAPQHVAAWMGIEPSEMKRYERVLSEGVEVV